ncbi:TIGR02444 family protein [Congregibacter sp.]|uniref:TIGR02444 family protein n=1 Tax=Congregibacter sp. TaxID=2744308 RepID=UPI003F6BF59D
MDAREQTNKQEDSSAASRLWHFAVDVYARPHVAELCLHAQEQWGVDVNLMLYTCWCTTQGRRLNAEDLYLAEARCKSWRDEVILPLRQQRKRWQGQPQCAAEYAAIKTLEIQAERTQLGFLAEIYAADSTTGSVDASAPPLLLEEQLRTLARHYELDDEAFTEFQRILEAP